jgi:2-iminobutanoate/2-iminopropanoate deaminase
MTNVTYSNPPGVPAPASRYHHAALLEGSGRRLVMSGQLGLTPEGSLPPEGERQIDHALLNIGTILAAHGMAPHHIVKLTCFLTDRSLIPAWRLQRDAFFAGHAPTSTLLIVAGLADPRFLVEVEAEAVA